MATYEDVMATYYGDPEAGAEPTIRYTHRLVAPSDVRRVEDALLEARDTALDVDDIDEAKYECELILNEANLGLQGLEIIAKSQLDPARLVTHSRHRASYHDARKVDYARVVYQMFEPDWTPAAHVRKVIPRWRPLSKTAGQLAELDEEYHYGQVLHGEIEATSDQLFEHLHELGFERDNIVNIAMAEFNPDALIQLSRQGLADRIEDMGSILQSARWLSRTIHYLLQTEAN